MEVVEANDELLSAAQAADEPAQSYDSVPLGPGECETRHVTSCPLGQPCESSEQTVCRADVSTVPLGGVGLPLGLALLGISVGLSWRRLRRRGEGTRLLSGLFGLAGVALLVTLDAGDSQALRYADRRRAPCGYVAPLIASRYNYYEELEYVLAEAVEASESYFTFRFTRTGQTDSNLFWSTRSLPGRALGDALGRVGRDGYLNRCEIRLDTAKIEQAAALQNADPYLFRLAAWKHEFGHCLALNHFKCAGGGPCPSIDIYSLQDGKTVMNDSMWTSITDSSLDRWNEWYRYSNGESTSFYNDVVGRCL